MRRTLFGKHLYNQVVLPLLLAALAVGMVATVVAVYFLSSVTDAWVDQVASSGVQAMATRIRSQVEDLTPKARMLAQDPALVDAVKQGTPEEIGAAAARLSVVLGSGEVFVIDGAGVVIAGSTGEGIPVGSRFELPGQATPYELSGVGPVSARLHDDVVFLVVKPIDTDGDAETDARSDHYVVLSQPMSDALLLRVSGGTGAGYAFYDSAGKLQAVTVSADLPRSYRAATEDFFRSPKSIISDVVEEARREPVSRDTRIGGQDHLVRAQAMSLTEAGVPVGYLVGVESRTVSQGAARTTVILIGLWSILAVIGLGALGAWIARRVSNPLIELAESAQRVAEGDFDAHVMVRGGNEVTALAESFNAMTIALRERGDALTKKVLELATLYEMSRALGTTLEMTELLEQVLDAALRIFDIDLGYVTLRNRETGALEIRAYRGSGKPGKRDGALRSSMADWVVREGRPLMYNPPKDAPSSDTVDALTGARAGLSVPLVSSEGTIGAVTVASSDPDFRFTTDDVRLLSTVANHVAIAVGNIELFTSLQHAYLATVRSLAAAVDAKDPYTRGHSDKVAAFAVLIAEKMGLSHEQRVALEMAAYLHDIGKIGIKEDILLKPGRLTDDEMSEMRHHPLIGANILKPVAFPWTITPVVRHHHERWDGSGYPAGLRGEEIPLLARIITVADSYEAMIANRPYKAGRRAAEAMRELQRHAGSQFDPRIVEVFAEIMGDVDAEVQRELDAIDEVIEPDEARAIFVALCDGMFSSFRRLGGPRLAANVEDELNRYFAAEEWPFRFVAGRVEAGIDDSIDAKAELERMRAALRQVDEVMSRSSGDTLITHFYTEAMSALSGRMRRLAVKLDFSVHVT